ncbi:MAG: dependent oxidoreductase [Microbacteriaceae bacterium]|nr:dependent oxidoreductase [Microbacteriaceae bacterium]
MTSLWLDRSTPVPTDEFEPDSRWDIAVVGAGLTGLVTGLLFARAGMRVVILEARRVGAVATGNTTAKLSLLQGSHLSSILRHTARSTARAYVEANREGMEWLLRYCEEHGVAVQRQDAYSFASTVNDLQRVDEEYRAAASLGLDVSITTALDVPFPVAAAVRLPNQAQFDPMDVLSVLAADFRAHGGTLVEGIRATGIRTAGVSTVGVGTVSSARVRTDQGFAWADRVVLATGTPFLDRGLYFAKTEARRSYALAFRVPGEVPDGMYLSVGSPTRSVRWTPVDGERRLLVGGDGHPVGRTVPSSHVDALLEWTAEYFPGAELTHSWSAQDYSSASGIPFVGWMPRSRKRVYFATAYGKWGMTNAVSSALTLAADILGGNLPWAVKLHRRITTLADAGTFLGANAAVGVAAVAGWAGAWLQSAPSAPPMEGQGVVTHDGLRPIGIATVDGTTCSVSAICPHLFGVVSWNDAERTWDCPLHGSRFSATGERLEGPTVRDLS